MRSSRHTCDKKTQELEPVNVVAETVSALVTAGGGVIAPTHALNAQWSCHGEDWNLGIGLVASPAPHLSNVEVRPQSPW